MAQFIGKQGDTINPLIRNVGGSGGSGRVKPGDLITADLINSILDRLDALEDRVNAPTPTQPTFTVPTFSPTFTMPTFSPPFTFNPTLTFLPTHFSPTLLTPTFGPTATFQPTFIATLLTPTLGPAVPSSVFTAPAGGGIFHPDTEVTALPGIGDKEKTLLNNAGITNVKAVADAEPEMVAKTLNTNVDHATTLVSIARNVINR